MSAPKNILDDYIKFISPECDRGTFVQEYLSARGVDSAVLGVDGKRHIYVKLPLSGYSPTFRVKTVLAHYDRVEGSPGANDNSSGVFALMDFAVRLSRFRGVHNVRVFFTDGEELGAQGVREQGAYSLANVIQKAGIKDEDIFVFDCMGRGTVPVLGMNNFSGNMNSAFKKKYSALEKSAKAILSSTCQHWLNLPMEYSDNAGFLASGIPAVVFTMLPDKEAQRYMLALQNVPGFLDFVQHKKNAVQNEEYFAGLLPETWRLLHTAGDNLDSLTEESFLITARILDAIAMRKIF